MTEQSELEKVRAEKVAQAAGRIALVWQSQGVDRVRALEFLERRVSLEVAPGLKVYARCGTIASNGSSDEALGYFARRVHLHYAEVLGGNPKPFGGEPAPASDGAMEQAARVAAAREAASEAARRSAEQRARLSAQTREKLGTAQAEQGPRPDRAF